MVGLMVCAATLNWVLPYYWAYTQENALFAVKSDEQTEKQLFDSFGGPALSDPVATAFAAGQELEGVVEESGALISQQSLAIDIPNPLSNVAKSRDKISTYKVQKGDTPSSVASQFGISVQTILGANPSVRSGKLQLGQEITILPVSGVLYQVAEGDTVESIAAKTGVAPQAVLQFNKKAKIVLGESLIVPGGKPIAQTLQSAKVSVNLPSFPGYFILPTKGKNWGKIHDHNAVDIANACGTPVNASAEGLVAEAQKDEGPDGYGEYIMLEHPNGIKTRYAHLSKEVVSVGDYVVQGKQIGEIGNTGNSFGTTGCHLHFEVLGAKNPFGK